MAYAASVVGPELTADTKGYTWVITETECASGSEYSLVIPFPGEFTISLLVADKTAGSATTIRTEIGSSPGWTVDADGHIDQTLVAAAHIYNGADVRVPDGVSTLYVRSKPNAGADNTVVTKISVYRGHR